MEKGRVRGEKIQHRPYKNCGIIWKDVTCAWNIRRTIEAEEIFEEVMTKSFQNQ